MQCDATDLAAFCGVAGAALLWVYKRAAAVEGQCCKYVWIGDPVLFNTKRRKLVADGASKLHVIADFDRTLTSCFYKPGVRGMSAHGLLESSPHLSAEYHAKARGFFNKYHPLETAPNLTPAQKTPIMTEWYDRGHNLLIEQTFRKQYITEAVRSGNVRLRDGARDLITDLGRAKVPLLVLSAGLGDVLEEVLRQKAGKLPPTTHVIANRMIFNENEVLVNFSKPLIHMFNKHERHHPEAQYYKEIEGRGNVILLGDSIGDLHMADGLDHDMKITIGFLNERADELWEQYLAKFDVVILNDGDMSFVNELVHDIIMGDVIADGPEVLAQLS